MNAALDNGSISIDAEELLLTSISQAYGKPWEMFMVRGKPTPPVHAPPTTHSSVGSPVSAAFWLAGCSVLERRYTTFR
jgi:hypothetical protein